jgi:hypothetical protein
MDPDELNYTVGGVTWILISVLVKNSFVLFKLRIFQNYFL